MKCLAGLLSLTGVEAVEQVREFYAD